MSLLKGEFFPLKVQGRPTSGVLTLFLWLLKYQHFASLFEATFCDEIMGYHKADEL